MGRSIINSDTFEKIFINKKDLLASLVSSLTEIDYKKLKNNITCDSKNPNNFNYVVRMPKDYILEILDTKKGRKIVINLKNSD